MARLYADEHNVSTVRETGLSKSGEGMPDELVFQYAAQQQRIVLTFNERDFRRLHGLNARHSGVLCCPETPAASAKKVARQIDRFLKRNDMNSRVERLPPV